MIGIGVKKYCLLCIEVKWKKEDFVRFYFLNRLGLLEVRENILLYFILVL